MKNGTLRNNIINWIFLQRFPIQNHQKSSVTEKISNKTKYLTGFFIRLIKFLKKTSIPNPLESFGYIRCNSSIRPTYKKPSSSIRCNCQKICSSSRRPKTILEIRKKLFLQVIKKPIIDMIFKERRLTGQQFLAVHLSPTCLNTGKTIGTFQKCGKYDSFRDTLKSSASIY